MTELLLKDQLDLQRRAAERAEWEKVSNLQEAHSVLRTRFEGQLRRYEEAMSIAVSQEDLKSLRREFSDRISAEIVQMHTDIDRSNQAWAEKILSGAKVLNAEAQIQRMDEQRRFRQQVLLAIFGATLSLFVGLFIVWETSRPN